MVQYPGGKNAGGSFQRIINQIPPHDVFIELFAGSAPIWRHKTPAGLSILVDLDEDALDALALQCESRESCTDKTTILVKEDALKWLREFKGKVPGWFLYCDPPYHPAALRSRQRYRHKFKAEQHRELLGVLRGLTVPVAISGYRCADYDRSLRSWRRIDWTVQTRSGLAVESLWMNFDEPAVPHCLRWIGDDRRRRETLKRRRKNLLGKLRRMPAAEREQLLLAIAQEFGGAD